jgi:hypothetical protein
VHQTLCMKDFSSTWCKWVASFMEGGHVGIKINDQVGKISKHIKELDKEISSLQFYSI